MHNGAESVGSSNTPVCSNRPKNRGFTIVELLVVIVVIGILAAITIVSYTGISQRATVASLQSDLANSANILKLDQVVGGNYPTSLTVANSSKGINPSPGNSYTYAYNNKVSPQTFCIAATKGTTSYKITNDSVPVVGDCQSYGLVLNLDAGDSTSYPSPFTGTSWNDLSGNNNNGTLVNGVGYNSANLGSLVIYGINDYITIPSSASLNVQTGDMAVSGWFNNTGTASGYIIGKDSCGDPGIWSVALNSAGTLTFRVVGSSSVSIASPSVTTNGVWHYFTAVKVGTNMYLYADGVQVVSGVVPSSITTTGIPVMLGVRQGFLSNPASCGSTSVSAKISTVRVYNRAMLDAEVLQNYNLQKGRYGL